jgi:hypothetical protein
MTVVNKLAVLARVVTAAALVTSGAIHLHLASRYAPIRTSVLSQQELFIAQGVVAIVAAAAILARGRRPEALLAFLAGAGSLTAVLVYYHVNVGRIGIVPNMYEPVWYTQKTLSAYADGVSAAGALAVFVLGQLRARRAR